ncbi:Outer membrane protein assembly factor BamB [subsurface metagenome]
MASTSAAIQDGIGYIVSNRGNIWAINIKARNWIFEHKITPMWRTAYLYGIAPKPPVPSGFIWSHNTMADGRCSPMVIGNVIYTGTGNDLIALTTDTGEELWRFVSGATIASSPAFADNTVYVGSDDSNLYALDADSGAVRWEFPTGDRIVSSPAVADGVVYVGSYDGKLYAIE